MIRASTSRRCGVVKSSVVVEKQGDGDAKGSGSGTHSGPNQLVRVRMNVKELIAAKNILILHTKMPREALADFVSRVITYHHEMEVVPSVWCDLLDFIEDACVKDFISLERPLVIPKVLPDVKGMLESDFVPLRKRAIQVSCTLYKSMLIWLCCFADVLTDEVEEGWRNISSLKKLIVQLLDSDMDGVRTIAVKFVETVILLQTPTEPDSLKRTGWMEFCLDNVPLSRAKLWNLHEDARTLFDELLKFHGTQHITSVNLMTCMGSLVQIAKMRPSLFGKVVGAIERLHDTLPPTLDKSQINSIRKYTKVKLTGLFHCPRATKYFYNITVLYTSFLAKADNVKHGSGTEEEVLMESEWPIYVKLRETDVAVDLVIQLMKKLPEQIPHEFWSEFKPIGLPSRDDQVRYISKMLAAQNASFQDNTKGFIKNSFT